MIKAIYVKTVNDAFWAYKIMQKIYGDCDIRVDDLGEYHITAPVRVLAILVGGIEDDRKKKSRKV